MPDRPNLDDLPMFTDAERPTPGLRPLAVNGLTALPVNGLAARDPMTDRSATITIDSTAPTIHSGAAADLPSGGVRAWLNPLRGNSGQPQPVGEVDWALVRAFRQQAADELSAALRDRDTVDPAEERRLGDQIVRSLLKDHADGAITAGQATFDPAQAEHLRVAVMNSLFGLGRLQPLVDDPDIENIRIAGHAHVRLDFCDGRTEHGPPVADSDEELIEQLQFLATRQQANERPFSPANPRLHLRLDGGSRLAASAWVSPVPQIVIRRHRMPKATLATLTAGQMMPPTVANLLAAAIDANKSVVVAGPQGAGKTTLARALCLQIGPWEQVATIETEYELHLHELDHFQVPVFAFEGRPGSGERGPDGKQAGEVTLDELVYDSWRFSLSRLIIGEVRGKEIQAMWHALSGGGGSICTVHARSGRAAIERLVTLSMEAGPQVTPGLARRKIAEHVDFIVQVNMRMVDGQRRRYVSEVLAVESGDDGGIAVTDVFRATPDTTTATPRFLPQYVTDDLAPFGFDPTPFRAVAQ